MSVKQYRWWVHFAADWFAGLLAGVYFNQSGWVLSSSACGETVSALVLPCRKVWSREWCGEYKHMMKPPADAPRTEDWISPVFFNQEKGMYIAGHPLHAAENYQSLAFPGPVGDALSIFKKVWFTKKIWQALAEDVPTPYDIEWHLGPNLTLRSDLKWRSHAPYCPVSRIQAESQVHAKKQWSSSLWKVGLTFEVQAKSLDIEPCTGCVVTLIFLVSMVTLSLFWPLILAKNARSAYIIAASTTDVVVAITFQALSWLQPRFRSGKILSNVLTVANTCDLIIMKGPEGFPSFFSAIPCLEFFSFGPPSCLVEEVNEKVPPTEASVRPLSDGPKFCPQCGTACAGQRFCSNCGHHLQGGPGYTELESRA